MKKGLILGTCLLLLTACSSSGYSVEVSDSKQNIVSGDITLSKQEYFEYLLDSYGADEVITQIYNAIADKELTDQDEIDKLVKERQDLYASYSDGNLKEYVKSIGYDSVKAYTNDVILPSIKQELLRKKYIKENLESLLTEHQVVSIKQIIVEKESDALTIIKASTNEKSFDNQMKAFSDNAEDLGIVTKSTTLDEKILDVLGTLAKTEKDGVYGEAIQLSDGTYAVVFIYDTERKKQDDYINALDSDYEVQEEIQKKYFEKYHFQVNDDLLEKAINNVYSDLD